MAKMLRTDSLKPHPELVRLVPPLSDDEYAALKSSIEDFKIRTPIVVAMPERIILDGLHRWKIATELGIAEVPCDPEEFLSAGRQITLGVDLNASRRQWVDMDGRKALAGALLKADATRTDRFIGRLAHLSHPLVAKLRKDLEDRGDVEKNSTRTDRTGRKQEGHKSGVRPNAGRPRKNPDAPQQRVVAVPVEKRSEQEAPEPTIAVPGSTVVREQETLATSATLPGVGDIPTGARSTDESGQNVTNTAPAVAAGHEQHAPEGAEPSSPVARSDEPAPMVSSQDPAIGSGGGPSPAFAVLRHIAGFGPVRSLPQPTKADLLAMDDADAEDLLLLSMWLKSAHTRRKNLLAEQTPAGAAA